jgi:hypothetical protein
MRCYGLCGLMMTQVSIPNSTPALVSTSTSGMASHPARAKRTFDNLNQAQDAQVDTNLHVDVTD